MSVELKSSVSIVVTKGNNVYTFSMPVGAPLGEAYDVSWEIVKSILGLSKQAVDQTELKKNQQDQYSHSGE